MAATAKVITLRGDKSEPESAEHIINFPGGHVAVMRTADGSYWAHIARERDEHEGSGMGPGAFLESRVDYETRHAGDALVETLEGDDLVEVRLALHPRNRGGSKAQRVLPDAEKIVALRDLSNVDVYHVAVRIGRAS